MTVEIVPFTRIQEEIKFNCPEEYFTLIMRRFMMRIAERIAKDNGAKLAVKRFVRVETGEGIEKKEEDFAAVSEEGLPSCVRASVLSRLALTGEECVYILGDSDGRLAAECAAALDRGLVYAACPSREEAERTLENAKQQYLHNMTILQGQVPSVLMHLPDPDAACFMDADAETEPLTEILLSRNPLVRLVSVTDCIESCSRTAQFFEARGIAAEVVQLTSVDFSGGRSHHRAGLSKPYYIISGSKRNGAYCEG